MNVIPGEATAHVNYRYAPGRTPEEAEARLAELCDGHGELRIDANAPSGPVARGPLVDALIAAGELERGAQAGVDAGGGVRPRGRRGDQLRARRPAAGAYARRVEISVAALRPELPGAGALRRGAMKPSPILSGLKTYPFVRLTDAKRELSPAGSTSSTSASASRARTRRRSSARRWRRALHAAVDLPAGRGPAGAARGDRRVDRAALRAGARPRHRGPPHARLQGGDLPPRPGRRRRLRGRHHARLPGGRARRGVRRQAGARAPAGAPSAASSPTSTPSTAATWDARRSCGSTTRTTRPPRPPRSSSTSAPPRSRASTTSWSPPTRRTRRSTSARCRRCRRSRSPTAAT